MNHSILPLNLKRLLIPGLALLSAVCTMSGAQTNSIAALAPFELRDQYNCPHRISFPAAGVTLMTVADRKGSEQIDGWVGPLKEHYGGRIAIEGIADLSAVPCLLRSMVREQFKKRRAYPVMLDWEGPVVRRFNYRKDEANLFVVDREGYIAGRVAGAATDGGLKTLFAAIDGALSKPSR